MAKNNDFRDKVNQLADTIRNKPTDTPIQEVRPVQAPLARKPGKEVDPRGAHFNFYGEPELMDRIKAHAFTERKTMKEVCNEALAFYLAHYSK